MLCFDLYVNEAIFAVFQKGQNPACSAASTLGITERFGMASASIVKGY